MSFDPEVADRSVAFFEKLLRHTKGKWAGVPFSLLPWQLNDIVRPLFGTLKADGARQYATAYIEVPKKAGKSELAAGVALKLLVGDDEALPEIYSAATTREQAGFVFNVAAQMVHKEPLLAERCRVIDSRKRIVVTQGKSAGGFYQAISAEAGRWDGVNPSGIIFDEIHEQRDRKLWDVLTSSTVARRQSLVFAITTAGYNRHSLCWDLHEKARRLLNKSIEDPSFLPVIYGAAEDADWRDPKVWAAAHPSLGVTLPMEKLLEKFRDAEQSPAYQNEFRRYFLNQWVSQESRWLDMGFWDLNGGEIDLEHLKGRTCYAGLDLASTTDLAALVLVFPPITEGAKYTILPFFWMPGDNIRDRSNRDRVPYERWAEDGTLIATEGNVIHYAAIRQKLDELARLYDIAEVAFDPWGATQMMQELDDAGMRVIEFRQGFASMSAPTKDLMTKVMEKRINHGGNEILRWNVDNVVVQTDPAGNIKISKQRSVEKVDGAVALVMALDRAVRNAGGSVYETRGVLSFNG